ncbi:hypothetical protein FRB94_009321 [Tulasnella sp. JGI-2019a]|nr:hypothetical protein FRB93_008854 [Tulasnella sp. JGI-2019a]KAG8995246.1 hypothetical protein FRB94_009321 [Tulasnella sp. JGI-2019a]
MDSQDLPERLDPDSPSKSPSDQHPRPSPFVNHPSTYQPIPNLASYPSQHSQRPLHITTTFSLPSSPVDAIGPESSPTVSVKRTRKRVKSESARSANSPHAFVAAWVADVESATDAPTTSVRRSPKSAVSESVYSRRTDSVSMASTSRAHRSRFRKAGLLFYHGWGLKLTYCRMSRSIKPAAIPSQIKKHETDRRTQSAENILGMLGLDIGEEKRQQIALRELVHRTRHSLDGSQANLGIGSSVSRTGISPFGAIAPPSLLPIDRTEADQSSWIEQLERDIRRFQE